MKKLLEWIKNHIFLTLVLCVLAFAVPLVVIHALFTIAAPHNWLVATWTAGELLAYIAGFEALLGTVILGFVTVYQSDKANEANERLNKENNYLQKISIQQMLPLLKVSDVIVHKTRTHTHQRLWNSNVVTVSEVGTTDKREPHVNVYLPLLKNGQCYSDTDCQKRLIKTFLNSVFVYDDKVVLTFNYSGDDRTITLHEIDGGLGHSIRIPSSVVHQKKRLAFAGLFFLFPRRESNDLMQLSSGQLRGTSSKAGDPQYFNDSRTGHSRQPLFQRRFH